MDKNRVEHQVAEQAQDERGASMLEYVLLAALIAVVCIAAITFLGTEASQTFSNVASSINTTNG